MTSDFITFWYLFIAWFQHNLKKWTKPTTESIITGSFLDLQRSRIELIAENALLRQQLMVLNRQVKHPQMTHRDRVGLVLLSRLTKYWKQAIHMVQPETILRWHRELFRLYWKRKSKTDMRKPRISPETIALIQQMAKENRLWGAERIQGELLKLGIQVSKRTVQRYLPKKRRSPSQNWATFLNNLTGDIWACDFTIVYDLLFRPIFIFVILELKSRLVIHTAITQSPTDEWTAQQLREATPWDEHPKYLIRDHDRKYGTSFSFIAARSGIIEIKTPFQAPKANAICERFIGSLKRECLDHMLILHQRQLDRVMKEYVSYYNDFRPHQGIQQRIPGRYGKMERPPEAGKVISRPIMGGLHHDYSRTTYLN